jgi:tetratricopeptide (TPR) repeat protein
MSPRCRSVVLLVLLGMPAVAAACLWDYDTLKQERSRFPSALELITGKFLRHSKEFYEWRVQDRLYKLSGDPTNLGYHDDLAVAYQKTGQHAKAVETMLAKEKVKPGVYETYSNLGTFYILAGEFEKGLPYIDQALAINPDAHFGRERYQKWLVEYAMEKRKDGKVQFPLRPAVEAPASSAAPSPRFHEYLARRLGKEQLSQADSRLAVKGVLGMMRFANHDNPLLLEALGDLLGHGSPVADAKHLASRAYLKASYAVEDPAVEKAYRELAEQALRMQTQGPNSHDQVTITDLKTTFAAELTDAEKWYAELRDRELSWIRDGKDVEAEFDRLYTEEPQLPDPPSETASDTSRTKIALVGGAAALLLVGCLVLVRLRRRLGPAARKTPIAG